MIKTRNKLLIFLLSVISTGITNAATQISISPTAVALGPGQTQQFSVKVTGTSLRVVSWSVNGITGGSSTAGTISANGLYTAPSSISATMSVAIAATTNTAASVSATATVTLQPTAVVVTPGNVSLKTNQGQQFSATVNGKSSTVAWSMNPVLGALSSSGMYTAPAAVSTTQNTTITATANGIVGTATVTVSPTVTISLSPSTVTLAQSQTQQFTASISGATNTAVSWTLNPAVGTISTAGLYTAPTQISASTSVIVTATSAADPTQSASATITLAPPVSVFVSPTTASLTAGKTQQFAANVSGTSTAVTWSLNPAVGTISTNGLYTAPATVSTASSVTVIATSTADTTKTASATVSLVPTVSVTVSPATVSLSSGNTQLFAAAVAGTSNTAVTWSLNPAVGTISTGGLYTAPASVSSSSSVAVTATSAADSTKTATASISLVPAVSVTVSPTTASLTSGKTQQFAATVSGTTNTAVTWSLNPAVGTISSSGLYTAPAGVSNSSSVTVIATSAADGTKTASATVSLAPTVSVTVSPTTASLTSAKTQQFAATVSGATNTAVTWSLNPAVGTISTSGLYTAPPTISTSTSVTVTATSAADTTKAASATIALSANPLSITTSTLPSATTNSAYSTVVAATGGSAPYNWSLAAGLFPAGITLAGTGTISGTTTAAGTYTITVQVTDSAGKQATATLSLLVALCSACSGPVSITPTSLPAGALGVSYNAILTATGGTPPYTWSAVSGQLPPGLTLASSGAISGTPTTVATYSFIVQVKDSVAVTSQASEGIVVGPTPITGPNSLTMVNADLPNGTVNTPYTATVSATGGTPPYSWSIVGGTLPLGMTLNSSSGGISGTPSAVGWSSFFTIQVADSAGSSTAKSYTVNINPILDIYGGISNQYCPNSTGRFTTVKINSRWWLCTPLGHPYWAISSAGMNPTGDGCDSGTGLCSSYNAIVKAKYGDVDRTWGPQQVRRVQSWGFNSIGQISSGWVTPWQVDSYWPGDHTQPAKLPGILTSWSYYAVYNLNNYAPGPAKDLTWGTPPPPIYTNWRATLLDFYDQNVWTWEDVSIANNPAFQKSLNSPWTLGVLVDDTDWMWGFGFGPDFRSAGGVMGNVGWWNLTTSPIQTFNINPNARGTDKAQLYADLTVYSKAGIASPQPTVCDIYNPCSLRDSLKLKYGTIAALNAAWGSNYSTFDSSGLRTTGELIGTGDGTTKTFTHVLAHTAVAPLSVQLAQAGVLQGGDCPWWHGDCNIATANRGTILGPSGSKLVSGYTPWLSKIYGATAPGYPDAAYQALILWHYPDGSTSVSSPSRIVSEHITNQQPFVIAPGPDPTGTATGYDVYMGCELYAGTPIFGCTAPGVTSTLTLQATNIPVNQDWGAPPTGLVVGASVPAAGSFIDYQSGQFQVTFSVAPPAGQPITVNYTSNGWHSGGTGLMDEDGSHFWVGTNPFCLTPASQCNGVDYPLANANAVLGNDVENWIAQFSAKYHKSYKAVLQKYNPNVLFMGPDALGTWGAPPRKEILWGAAPYIDVLFPGITINSAQIDFINQHFGDKPILGNFMMAATPDSALYNYQGDPGVGIYDFGSQEARGRAYLQTLQNLLNTVGTTTGTYPFVGADFWGLTDFWNEKVNWGLVSLSDNPYDGKSSCKSSGVDSWGYPTGGEAVVPTWQAGVGYGPPPAGNTRIQANISGTIYIFQATVAGTSSTVQPTWPVELNATVMDGSVQWKNIGTKAFATCFGDAIDYVKQGNSLWYQLMR